MSKLVAVLEAMGLWPRRRRSSIRFDSPPYDDTPPDPLFTRSPEYRWPYGDYSEGMDTGRKSDAAIDAEFSDLLHDREEDGYLLLACDSLLSLIRYRELTGLTSLTIRELDSLIPKLRARTDELTGNRRGATHGRTQAQDSTAARRGSTRRS